MQQTSQIQEMERQKLLEQKRYIDAKLRLDDKWMRLREDLPSFIKQTFKTVSPGHEYVHNWHIDAISEYLIACQKREIRRLIINMPPRSLKPLDSSTMVAHNGGMYKELKDIKIGDTVLTHMGRYMPVTDVHKQGMLETIKITTHSGREVISALDHPFLTPHGWVEAGKLNVGDVLGLVVPTEDNGIPQSPEECRMAGYFVGDGQCGAYTNKKTGGVVQTANITCGDPLIAKDILHCSKEMGWSVNIGKSGTRYNISGGVRSWLTKIGLAGCVSSTKVVPKFIFEGNNEAAANFIAAYFDCDGTVGSKNKNNITLSISSISKELLAGVQKLLVRFGIYARIRRRENINGSKWQPANYVSYTLDIGICNDVEKFHRLIPLRGKKKKILDDRIKRRTDFDKRIMPDPIVSIDAMGKRECLCLTVDEDHSFTAYDIAVHNSIAVSVGWPAFLLGHNPSAQIMAASYSQTLAYQHSLDTREVIRSEWFKQVFPELKLSADQNEKSKFTTTARGHRMAVSVGSSATGAGGDYLIADDTLNPQQAASEAERETANKWFSNTFISRQNDKNTGVIVLVMQRLDEMDTTGMLLAQGGWEHLCLEARSTQKKTISIGKFHKEVEKGELLDPIRLSESVLKQLEREMTAQTFSGQYQQDPAPSEGGILKKKYWRVWPKDDPPECVYVTQTYDTAFNDGQEGDFTARTTWGVFKHKGTDDKVRYSVVLLEATKGRWSYPELKAEVISSAKIYNPDAILIEKKASGISLIQDLRRMRKHRIIAVRADGGRHSVDKVARANIASIVLEKGAVWTMDRDWKDDVIKECYQFPNGKNDDFVDSCVMTWLWLRNRYWLNIPDDFEEDADLVKRARKVMEAKTFYGHSATIVSNN